MRTIKTKVYQFSELSEQAKQKAIEWGSNLNVDHNWWDFTYEDAENIGLKLTGFDIDRGSYCTGKFIKSSIDCATKIMQDHGESCETYKTSKLFASDYEKFANKSEQDEDVFEEMQDEFLKEILEDYRIILSNEYDYLTGEKAIIEAIESNEYEFTEDGKRF